MIGRIFLGFNAIVIGLIGLAYLYDPNLLLARYGLETGGAAMDNMLRAVYGGLFVGIAALLALGVVKADRLRDMLGLATIFFASQAIGRIASVALAGSPASTVLGLLYYELAATAIGLLLFLKQPRVSA